MEKKTQNQPPKKQATKKPNLKQTEIHIPQIKKTKQGNKADSVHLNTDVVHLHCGELLLTQIDNLAIRLFCWWGLFGLGWVF